MLILNLNVSLKNEDAVISFLADVIQDFLVRHGFRTVNALSQDESNKRKRIDTSDVVEMESEPGDTDEFPNSGFLSVPGGNGIYIDGPSDACNGRAEST